jgi:Patatin-like phospholipase
MAEKSTSAPLTTDEILREEALAIHGPQAQNVANKSGSELYRELYALNSAALCLSGGGIRSAAFALGVIQALATHPRPPGSTAAVASEHDSLLSRFHYLSTVSGGGYAGGWLSAWINRIGFGNVWQNLVTRPGGCDVEPANLAWLRTYSNYLTPRIGAMSADTWAAVAIMSRNLLLNWLVILPVLCALLLGLKLYTGAIAWISLTSTSLCTLTIWNPTLLNGVVGVLLLLISLSVRTYNLPTRQHSSGGQAQFLAFNLAPTVLATLFFVWALATPCLYVVMDNNATPFFARSLNATIWYGLLGGIVLYAVSWFTGKPTYPRWKNFFGALIGWIAAGAIFGVLIALAASLAFRLWMIGTLEQKWGNAEIVLFICGVPWVLMSQLVAEMIFVGLTSKLDASEDDREWLGRAAGWMLAVAVAWPILMALVFLGSVWASALYAKFQAWMVSIGGLSGLVTALLGKSRYTTSVEKSHKAPTGLQIAMNVVLVIAATIFSVALIVVISGLIDQLLFRQSFVALLKDHTHAVESGYPPIPHAAYLVVASLAVVGVVGFFASKYVNINRFSLHALYRNRIVRAFLGGSNPERNKTRNPFTDFDEKDNLAMSKLWVSPRPDGDGWRPFHVVNMALNIVSSQKLAWQERKAEPFTVSPLHSGSACKKYRRTGEYGHRERGISLGTAVAISGAAASPNMGYHSSPAITLLLALLNVRLGWWLGNPGEEGEKTYRHEGPRMAIRPLLSEMFGLTTDDNKYIYLSDGGHFENLGIYEMVRRRCRLIVVSDAGWDPKFKFEDLGNAVRKISLDLGVRIDFRGVEALTSLIPENDQPGSRTPLNAPYHAIATIHYPDAAGGGEKGLILYIKPAYHGGENIGIQSYAMANPGFPHQGTGDQFFSESQFESYRALGFEIADNLLSTAFSGSGRPQKWSVEEIAGSLDKTVPAH